MADFTTVLFVKMTFGKEEMMLIKKLYQLKPITCLKAKVHHFEHLLTSLFFRSTQLTCRKSVVLVLTN